MTMKPRLGDRLFYSDSGFWMWARILLVAGPAVFVLAIGMTMFIDLWN